MPLESASRGITSCYRSGCNQSSSGGSMTSADTLNLRHVRAFLAVRDLGSTLSAAAAVHLSQPAVTQAIAKLEQLLAVRLFSRHSAGMTATDAGEVFGARAERALSFVRLGAEAAGGSSRRGKGRGFGSFDRLVTTAQLRALIAVADSGNFSLAARSVGVSQPSLHRLARDLERLTGGELFQRRTHGIALTEGAAEFARYARLAFNELEHGIDELGNLKGVERSRLHIGALPLVRTGILPKTIYALSRLHPSVRIRIVDGPYDNLLHALRHGEIDVLIGALREPVPIGDVVQRSLFVDRLSVVARKGHPLGRKRGITVRDLARYPWVAPREGPPARASFERLFASGGVDIPGGLVEASSLVVVRGLLLESERLTLLSAHQIEPEIRHGMLEILPFDAGDTARTIGYTLRRDWRPTPLQTAFLELLERLCATPAMALGRNECDEIERR